MTTATTLARGLGVLSVGLGLTQVLAPRWFARSIGVRPTAGRQNATLAVGLRELAAGAGLLSSPKPIRWPWVRFGGDLLDMALIAGALRSREAHRGRLGAALLGVAGIGAVDLLTGLAMLDEQEPRAAGTTTPSDTRRIRKAVTVLASRDDAYDRWRDFERLPRFMQHLDAVELIDARRSRWRAKAPAGQVVEWEAEITEDRPGEVIAWRSVEGSGIPNAGRVSFLPAPGDRGTEVHVELEYAPPLGSVGAVIARILGEEPEKQTADDLRRFKQMLETGRVVWSDATIGDRRLRQRAAQPPDRPVQQPAGRPSLARSA